LNHLGVFGRGKGKEQKNRFGRQGYTKISSKFIILLHKDRYDYVTHVQV